MFLGIIADDFTGGTDIAGFLTQNGLSVIQYIGIPEPAAPDFLPDAAVISLKSRSRPVEEAVAESLAAMQWLRDMGCGQIFFKYCSTFDSTAKGNIGPVTDALLDSLGCDLTVMVPALPVNGRTVYNGYLFVNGVPLNESGMQYHPVTPMLDANLMRLTERQARGKAANIPLHVVESGAPALRACFRDMEKEGIRYAIPDVLTENHLHILGEAVRDMPLVTGGSGLGAGIARNIVKRNNLSGKTGVADGMPSKGKTVILAGSASKMTNAQVRKYREKAASLQIDVRRCVEDAACYAAEVCSWVASLPPAENAPIIYATTNPQTLAAIQKEFGPEISGLSVERFFASLAAKLNDKGFERFIIAGGETSGSVVKALGVKAFHIGPQIAPGVPWVRAVGSPICLALKSGNFGNEDFFFTAQEFLQ